MFIIDAFAMFRNLYRYYTAKSTQNTNNKIGLLLLITSFFGTASCVIMFMMIAIGHRFYDSTGLRFVLIMTMAMCWANCSLQAYYFVKFNLRFDLNKARSRRTIPIVKNLFIFFYLICVVSLLAIFIVGAILQRGIFTGLWVVSTFATAALGVVAVFFYTDSIITIKAVENVNEDTISQKKNALTLLYIYLIPGTVVANSVLIVVNLLLAAQIGGYLTFLIYMFFSISAYGYSLSFAIPRKSRSKGDTKNITS